MKTTLTLATACAIAAILSIAACGSDATDSAAAGTGGAAGAAGGSSKGGAAGVAGTAGQAGAAGAEGGTPVTCTKLTVKDLFRDPEFGKPEDKYSAIVGTPQPALGTDTPDEFQLQLYEFSASQAPGTFDLADGAESNFSTCKHCVLVFEDMDSNGDAKRYFFQQAGELTLTINPTPTTGEVMGTLKNVKLVEVEIDYAGGTYVSTPVPGGACLELDSVDIDTTSPETDGGADAAEQDG